MARKASTDREKSKLEWPRPDLEKSLDTQIAKGHGLIQLEIGTPAELEAAQSDYYKWTDYNRTLIERAFSTGAELRSYDGVGFGTVSTRVQSLLEKVGDFQDRVETKLRRLESLRSRLELYVPPEDSPHSRATTQSTGDIFVVHGHSQAVKESVRSTIEALTDRVPVILDQQADRGRTIIEKFEDHGGQAAFAVILLTADDEGRVFAEGAELRPRGRQNVVFEFGYFVGRLGRSRTVLLYEPGVELPSDLSGLIYVELDADCAWQNKLARELRAAGIPVDMNKLL